MTILVNINELNFHQYPWYTFLYLPLCDLIVLSLYFVAPGCPPPLDIRFAAITGGDGFTYVIYTCQEGFVFEDGARILTSICLETLQWDNEQVACDRR